MFLKFVKFVLGGGAFAKGAPLNVTIDGATATVQWIFDHDAGGGKCTGDSETFTGLKVTRNATHMALAGTGRNPTFYSFAADISGDKMTGIVETTPGVATSKVGSFTAVRGGLPVTSDCNRCLIHKCEMWRGELDYSPYSKGAPMNVTIAGATARVDMVFDKDASGNVCKLDVESNLKVTRNATHIALAGTGKNPSFYSFVAAIIGDTMSGAITSPPGSHSPIGQKSPIPVGTFTAVRNGRE